MLKIVGITAASGKNVTAIVITALLLRNPPAMTKDAFFSVPHLPTVPFNLASKKPMIVKTTHNSEAPQIKGSLNLMLGATAAELAAITRIKHIFANGSRAGQIILGIFPLPVSFNVTPMIVGTTTIKRSETAIALISIATFAPIKIDMVAGTARGARSVSMSIRERASALSPLKIVTHIKPETAVGPANNKTNPVIRSISVKMSEDEKRAMRGIKT